MVVKVSLEGEAKGNAGTKWPLVKLATTGVIKEIPLRDQIVRRSVGRNNSVRRLLAQGNKEGGRRRRRKESGGRREIITRFLKGVCVPSVVGGLRWAAFVCGGETRTVAVR